MRLLLLKSRTLLLTVGVLLFSIILKAQTKITGKVIDINQKAIAGASVTIKGNSTGVATDSDGIFSLIANSNNVLVVSFVGYQNKEIKVNSTTNLTIVLDLVTNSLDAVVVTGYSSQRKKDLTGAVAVLNVGEMNKQPTGQVTNQLQGLASGVTVLSSGQPGEEPRVAIRGLNTFGNNTPLYVVDGVPTQNLSGINPNDIASIQVLKDAGAASIYGSRASNGVLIITTKKGTGKVKVQYDAYYGTQRPKGGNVWDLLSPQDMANLEWKAARNSGITPGNSLYGFGATPVLPDYIMPVGAKEGDPQTNPDLYNINPEYTTAAELASFYRIVKANKSGTDWYHEVFKPSTINNHSISVSGGSTQGSYLLSFNYLDDKGTLIYTGLKRYSIRSNATYNISKQIRVGENLSYSISENPQVSTNNEGVVTNTYKLQNIVPVYDIKANFGGAYTSGGQLLGNGSNSVATQYRTRNNKGSISRLFGNVFAEIELFNHFTLRSSFGGENAFANYRSFKYPEYENPENALTNIYSENSSKNYNWTWTNTLTYQQNFENGHNIKALIGTESYKNQYDFEGASNSDYFSFNPDFTTISSGGGTPSAFSGRSTDLLQSYFARADYSFKGKYLLGATIRRDGSSKFLVNRWGWFPAVSGGWRVSDENFLQGIKWLNDLKIRGSWGIMGNQINVNAANSFTTFGGDKGSSYYDIGGTNNSLQQGFSKTSIGNPDAKWEKNINSNIGVDASLFNGKVEVSMDYYRKDIRDLLYNPDLPGTAGQGVPPFVNIASMKNSGFDAAVTGNFKITKNLKLTGTLTLTTYNNTITKVTDIINYFTLTPKRFGINIIRNEVGHPISSFYGYKINGFWDDAAEIAAANIEAQKATGNPAAVYQTDVRVGHFRYTDVNGDGIITDADRTFLGNPNPDFSYGLNLGLSYKNFDFSIFFYGVQGNEIWNQTKWWRDFYPTLGPAAKSNTAYYDSWTPDHKNAKVAIQEKVASFGTSSVPNSYYVENGSYLRMKNAQLGYNFSAGFLQKIKIDKMRLYVQAANLFTITKYSGIDPEVTGSATSFGIDEGGYAQARQFLFGMNLSF